MVKVMSGVQHKDRKRVTYFMPTLAIANSVRSYGHVLRKEDGHVRIYLSLSETSSSGVHPLWMTSSYSYEEKETMC